VNRQSWLRAIVVVVLALAGGLGLAGEGWSVYEAEDYGFSMLIPTGAKVEEVEDGAWGALHVKQGGVDVWGFAKMGEQAAAAEIEAFAVKQTGVDAKLWKEVDSGKGHGWNWYKTVKATDGKIVVFGGYGTGPRGTYLVLLRTTAADYAAHEADYTTWYGSVKLN
jgi:hypothetical protein